MFDALKARSEQIRSERANTAEGINRAQQPRGSVMKLHEALKEEGTSAIDTYVSGRVTDVEYPCLVRAGIESPTAEHMSYEVYLDEDRIARFLYIDLGDKCEDLAVAYARGINFAWNKFVLKKASS
jgi:hypothetical protein